jgi:glyoxylase-like metal-dependent hydrolase (beta-lactamase superfamily II)
VPELYVRELAGSSQLVRVSPGMMVLPGMTAHLAPGHTPGHMIYAITGGERDVIFTGDAAKNRVELITLEADMTYDPAVTRASIELMWRLWRQKPDTVLVPGHDVPMVLKDGKPTYLGERRAAIASWFGEKLDQTTMISLVT